VFMNYRTCQLAFWPSPTPCHSERSGTTFLTPHFGVSSSEVEESLYATASNHRSLLPRSRQSLCPMRKMIQRLIVRRIEMQWRHTCLACKHSVIIRVRFDVFFNFLFVNPVIGPALWIFSFGQLIPRNFLRLSRELHAAVPRLRHIDVEQHLIRQSFL